MAGRTFHDSKQLLFSYAHNASMMLCHQMLPVSTFDLKSDLSSWGVRSEGQHYTWGIPRHTSGYIPGAYQGNPT